MKTKLLAVAVVILIACNIVLAALLLGGGSSGRDAAARGIPMDASLTRSRKHVLYIGLNDKDTGAQLVSAEEATNRLNAVAAGHVDGFTVFQARGYWRGGDDNLDSEATLVYVFYDAPEERMEPLLREMLAAMNQSAILVEREDAYRMFFE